MINCISPQQIPDAISQVGFEAFVRGSGNRTSLRLQTDHVQKQNRIHGRPTIDVARLTEFVVATNAWLPSDRYRLLWVDSVESSYPALDHALSSIRLGLGETRSVIEAPGHLCDPHPYGQQDQAEISEEQAKDVSILVGLILLTMIGGWDGWLIASGCDDCVEFWEGNILFYSKDHKKLKVAEALLDSFGCARNLE